MIDQKPSERTILSTEDIIAILWRDGYGVAARLLEDAQKQINSSAELNYMCQFVAGYGIDDEVSRNQLRTLWTAYCLHQDVNVGTGQYDSTLWEIWRVVQKNLSAESKWSVFDVFNDFMAEYLV